jgi:alanine dehydrogenase
MTPRLRLRPGEALRSATHYLKLTDGGNLVLVAGDPGREPARPPVRAGGVVSDRCF